MTLRLGRGFGEWLGDRLAIRMLVGSGFAAEFSVVVTVVFSELGKTEDWVLEYQNWIVIGVCVVAFGIWIGFVLVTRPNPAEKDMR
jgi:hypothetical protein